MPSAASSVRGSSCAAQQDKRDSLTDASIITVVVVEAVSVEIDIFLGRIDILGNLPLPMVQLATVVVLWALIPVLPLRSQPLMSAVPLLLIAVPLLLTMLPPWAKSAPPLSTLTPLAELVLVFSMVPVLSGSESVLTNVSVAPLLTVITPPLTAPEIVWSFRSSSTFVAVPPCPIV